LRQVKAELRVEKLLATSSKRMIFGGRGRSGVKI